MLLPLAIGAFYAAALVAAVALGDRSIQYFDAIAQGIAVVMLTRVIQITPGLDKGVRDGGE